MASPKGLHEQYQRSASSYGIFEKRQKRKVQIAKNQEVATLRSFLEEEKAEATKECNGNDLFGIE